MSYPTFSESEALFLLCEALKASDVSVKDLFNFIEGTQAAFSWANVGLPSGRSMSDCAKFYEALSENNGVLPTHAQRNPGGVAGGPVRPPTPTAGQGLAQGLAAYVAANVATLGTGRSLQPKPNGNGTAAIPTPQTVTSVKKRGRPSKADMAARAAAAGTPLGGGMMGGGVATPTYGGTPSAGTKTMGEAITSDASASKKRKIGTGQGIRFTMTTGGTSTPSALAAAPSTPAALDAPVAPMTGGSVASGLATDVATSEAGDVGSAVAVPTPTPSKRGRGATSGVASNVASSEAGDIGSGIAVPVPTPSKRGRPRKATPKKGSATTTTATTSDAKEATKHEEAAEDDEIRQDESEIERFDLSGRRQSPGAGGAGAGGASSETATA